MPVVADTVRRPPSKRAHSVSSGVHSCSNLSCTTLMSETGVYHEWSRPRKEKDDVVLRPLLSVLRSPAQPDSSLPSQEILALQVSIPVNPAILLFIAVDLMGFHMSIYSFLSPRM